MHSISLDVIKSAMANELFKVAFGKVDVSGIDSCFLNKSSYIQCLSPNGNMLSFSYGYDSGDCQINKLSSMKSGVEVTVKGDEGYWKTYCEQVDFWKKEQDIHKQWSALKVTFRSEVAQVLDGVNTTAQLLEQWPESEPFLPAQLNNPSSINLPAISISTLTNQLK